MSTTLLAVVSAAVAIMAGVGAFFMRGRSRKRQDAAVEATINAVVVKKQLDKSRDLLRNGDASRARSVAQLEMELADKKRALDSMRKDLAKTDASVQELLDELGM